MRIPWVRVLLPAVVLATACSATTAPESVRFERLRPGSFSYEFNTGLVDRERLVIRDVGAWAALWTRMYATKSPVPERPAVDFSREMIVVVAMGARATGGFGINMSSARLDAGDLVIEVVSRSPGTSCGTTQATTQPVDIARVSKFDGPVRFEERETVANCG